MGPIARFEHVVRLFLVKLSPRQVPGKRVQVSMICAEHCMNCRDLLFEDFRTGPSVSRMLCNKWLAANMRFVFQEFVRMPCIFGGQVHGLTQLCMWTATSVISSCMYFMTSWAKKKNMQAIKTPASIKEKETCLLKEP
eukprot:1158239-Pelagomonas_calceolata.AAC.2